MVKKYLLPPSIFHSIGLLRLLVVLMQVLIQVLIWLF